MRIHESTCRAIQRTSSTAATASTIPTTVKTVRAGKETIRSRTARA